MKIDYKKDHIVSYSDVDFNIKFGLFQVVNYVQDIFTTYFKSFGSDNPTIRKVNNAAWVISKTKVHFNKIPNLGELLKTRVYTTQVKPVRVICETSMDDENGENMVIIKQEICTIDIDSRKVRKLSTIQYPEDMEVEEQKNKEPFMKLNDKFSDDDFVYETRAYVSDIDYNIHVNNAIYIRYILNCFDYNFLKVNSIKDFEIHYVSESLEGEYLSVYKKATDEGYEFLIMCGDREVVRAYIKFEKLL